MKSIRQVAAVALLCLMDPAIVRASESFDLHALAKGGGLEVVNRDLGLVEEPAHRGIRLSKAEGEGVAWLKGVEFSEGVVEFDVRGENLKQHSFVGVAFHGQDNDTFDAVYFRPFQFREADAGLRARSIQYVSLPAFTWRRLREGFPGRYESSVDPVPDPDAWFHVRVVVKGPVVSAYVNGNDTPSLVVEKVTDANSGRVGLYVADTSGGEFANLTIQPASM